MTDFSRLALPGFELACIDHGARAFSPHFHDTFVLSVNVRGHEQIRLDGRQLEAGAGDVTLYNPGQIQSSDIVSERWTFLSLYLDPAVLPALFDLSADSIFERPLLERGETASQFMAAMAFALQADSTPEQSLERLMLSVAALLDPAALARTPTPRAAPAAVHRVAERLRDSHDWPSLRALAAEAGCSPVQLLRTFSRAYGLPPFTWAWNVRVLQARRRLALGEDIAGVAANLGFADQSHLTRRFRAVFGVPPGRWRRG